MKIIFVRHGESKSNAGLTEDEDSPLTRKGKMQAKYLANSLKKENISIIYTSNLLRAKQTGEIISKIIKVPIKASVEELNEYLGRHLRSLLELLFNRRLKRLKKFLKKISKDKGKNKTILIVAHAITNRIIMGYLLEIPLKKQLLFFRQHNTAMNSIYWSKFYGNWHMEHMNNLSHLPERLITISKY